MNNNTAAARARQAEWMLVVATFFWGATFSVVKDAINVIPVFAFLAIRFGLAGGLMMSWRLAQRRSDAAYKSHLLVGVALGVLLFLSFAFQTLGLFYTSAAKCAFITGLNLVWVACFAARHWQTWVAVGLAMVSLWLMILPGGEGGDSLGELNKGDFLTLLCSLFFAAHILSLARLPEESDSMVLSIIQFLTVAVLSLAASLVWEDSLLPSEWNIIVVLALFITVFGATIFSFWVQTHYQKFTTPTRTAIIFILEPVFAACIALAFYDESLSKESGFGALLILLAMWLSAHGKEKRLPAAK